MRFHFFDGSLWAIVLFLTFGTACTPEKDRQIFDNGAKYHYKFTKTDSAGSISEDTVVMEIKGGAISESLFDQIKVTWYKAGESENSAQETYVKDNTNGVEMMLPYDLGNLELAPVIPHPRIIRPLDMVDSWTLSHHGHLSGENIDSVKYRYQIKAKTSCQVQIDSEQPCRHLTGKNLFPQEPYGEWVLEAWFHPNIGFVKMIYDHLGTERTFTFELMEAEGLIKKKANTRSRQSLDELNQNSLKEPKKRI